MSVNLNVEIIYALPKEQVIFKVTLVPGSTIQQAIEASKILATYADIDLAINKVGVYSRLVKLDALVNDGERIEIYRPLIADPKEIRKRRAKKAADEGRIHKKTGMKIVK